MFRVTVDIRKSGEGDRLKKLITALSKHPPMVKVGFPAGKVAGDLVSIAYWNHEGTSRASGDVFFRNGKVGISGPIPPRPFITIAMFKHKAEFVGWMRAQAKQILKGATTIDAALPKLGMMGQDAIQTTITSGVGPPNSPMTIALKGSSKTLVDTGRMVQSVTWALDG